MTMGWMETIHFIGLDIEVAIVFAVAGLDLAARTLKRLADMSRSRSSAVTRNANLHAKNPYEKNVSRRRSSVLEGTPYDAAQPSVS